MPGNDVSTRMLSDNGNVRIHYSMPSNVEITESENRVNQNRTHLHDRVLYNNHFVAQ